MCFNQNNLDSPDSYYRCEEPECKKCLQFEEKIDELKDCVISILHFLQGTDELDMLQFDHLLSYTCEKVGTEMSSKPLNIERPSESIRMLQNYLYNVCNK